MCTISVQPWILELYLVNIALQPLTPRHVIHFYNWDLLDVVYMCIPGFLLIFIEKTMYPTIPTSFSSLSSQMSDLWVIWCTSPYPAGWLTLTYFTYSANIKLQQCNKDWNHSVYSFISCNVTWLLWINQQSNISNTIFNLF